MNDFDAATRNYEKALKIAKEIDNKKRLSISYFNIGILNYYVGNSLKAISYLKKSLVIIALYKV